MNHKCSKCGEIKPTDQFYPNKCQCKSCISKMRKVHYDANSERMRANCRAYYNRYYKKPKEEVLT